MPPITRTLTALLGGFVFSRVVLPIEHADAMPIDVDNGDGITRRTTRTAALDGTDVNVQGITNPA